MNAFFSKRRNNPNGRDGKDKLGKHKTQRKPGQALPPLPAKADGNTAVYAKIATTASSRFGVPRPSENETDAEDAIYSRIRGGQNSRSSLNLPPNESGADTDGGVYERLKFDRQGSDLFSTKDDIDAILKSDRNRASQPQKDPSGPVYDFAAKKEPIYSRVTKVRS